MITDEIKRRIREANSIVDVIQGAVGKLTRAGRNLKACCPFHNEKTPSFNINVEGQYFHCFGCGKSGDVFTFVMLHERVEFPEALRILADRAGIRLEFDPKAIEQHKKDTDWKSYLYKLNEVACKFYREQLLGDAGKAAREYLKKRGLSDEICEQFRLGYAPQTGSPLFGRLQSQRAPVKAILAAGLASQRDNGGIHDFFFDRLMFPITDIQGRVIAFGGRTLGDGEPKYLNTRDTLLFSKTHAVYGLDHAREEIVAKRQAIIVEGYTDVMMCHQFGVTNVVACLGTAITAEHIRQLRRVADSLLLLTDSDAAGAKASERSVMVLLEEEMPARVARLPGADKDPCDFLLAKGKEPFVEALGQSMELFEYKYDMLRQKFDVRTAQGLKEFVADMMALISVIPDTLLKNRYRYELAKRLNIDERDLRYDVKSPRTAAAAGGEPGKEVGRVPQPENLLARAERELLKFLFHQPAFLAQAAEQVDLANLNGKPERQIGMAVLAAISEGILPPDPVTLTSCHASDIVAREVLQRLHQSSEDGIVEKEGVAEAASLCISLAEAHPEGSKMDPVGIFENMYRMVLKETLMMRYEDTRRRNAHAKLQGDREAEELTYREMAEIRKSIAGLKTRNAS